MTAALPTQKDARLWSLTLDICNCESDELRDLAINDWCDLLLQGANPFFEWDMVRRQRISKEHERSFRLSTFEAAFACWDLESMVQALKKLPPQGWDRECVFPAITLLAKLPAIESEHGDPKAISRFLGLGREMGRSDTKCAFIGPWEALVFRRVYLIDDLTTVSELAQEMERHGLPLTPGTVANFQSDKTPGIRGVAGMERSSALLLLRAGPPDWWGFEREQPWAKSEDFAAVRSILDEEVLLAPSIASGLASPKPRM